MIAQLYGTVLAVSTSDCVVDLGGLGMKVLSTPETLAQLKVRQEVRLFTELVVREDALILYGFATEGERDTFTIAQSVSGVGPRMALAMLSVHTPESLADAVARQDRKALERVPGVGAKVASRILLELSGKLAAPAPSAQGAPQVNDARSDVVDALVGLGWQARVAEAAVFEVAPHPVDRAAVSNTLKAALKLLGGARG